MAKVYILSAHEYSDWTILGVYSSRDAAEAAKLEYERPYRADWQDDNDPPRRNEANDIWEVDLDSKIDPRDWPPESTAVTKA